MKPHRSLSFISLSITALLLFTIGTFLFYANNPAVLAEQSKTTEEAQDEPPSQNENADDVTSDSDEDTSASEGSQEDSASEPAPEDSESPSEDTSDSDEP